MFQSPRIRPLIVRRDILSVSKIESESFFAPLSPTQISDKLSGVNASYCGLAAEYQGHLIGYVLYRLRDHEAAIRRIAVDSCYRRQGVATSLLMAVRELSINRRQMLSILVDEYDLPSQLMLRRCGFRWTATLSGQFYKSTQDRYRMVMEIGQSSATKLIGNAASVSG